MRKFNMFITAVCFLFLIKLRWPKNKSIYNKIHVRSKSTLFLCRNCTINLPENTAKNETPCHNGLC